MHARALTGLPAIFGFLVLPSVVAAASAVPAAPSALVATPVSRTRIDLKWQDNSDHEQIFVVERRPSGSDTWTIVWADLNADFPQFSDMGLPPGGRFDYRVKARTKEGVESAPSNIARMATPTAPPLYNNLLRDRQACASSFQWRKVPAYQAVDGTQWTRWQSKRTAENVVKADWLYVDMGSGQRIDKVRIIWQRGTWAKRYEIQVSDDARVWQTVVAVEKSAVQTIEDRRFPPVTCRYVRFFGIESGDKTLSWGLYGGYSFYEFEAYAPDVDPDPLEWEDSSAFMKPVAVTRRPALAPGAVDGHMGTFWSAGPHGQEYSFTVDLGTEQDIYEIVPYWHVPTDAYQIQVSSDGESWRVVADQSNVKVTPVVNEEMREIHRKAFAAPESARYVRIVVTGKAIHADPKFTSIILQELLVHSASHGAPRAPEGLRVTREPSERVSLRWQDTSADETAFEVYRRKLGTSRWFLIKTVPCNVAMFVDSPLPPGEGFAYRVRAVNERGPSLGANESQP